RFYLLRDVSFGGDGNVGMDAVASRYEAELANEYGNLVSRTVAMLVRYRDGRIPEAPVDPVLEPELASLAAELAAAIDGVDLSGGLELIWQRVRRLNRYVEERKPWELARDQDASTSLDSVLVTLHRGLQVVTTELGPYMPDTSARVLQALAAIPLEVIPPLFPKTP
ncbi:MAG: methionine--tRNA ligase, partial [Actinomycetota bacterium]|nr:methionine--tRNA ligase [Actinomycetota bacterium]